MKQYQCDILDLLVQQVNVSGGGFRKNIGNFIKPKSKNKVVNVVSTRSMNARVANKVVNIVSAHANSNVFEKHLKGSCSTVSYYMNTIPMMVVESVIAIIPPVKMKAKVEILAPTTVTMIRKW
jgi:hypothetical protein